MPMVRILAIVPIQPSIRIVTIMIIKWQTARLIRYFRDIEPTGKMQRGCYERKDRSDYFWDYRRTKRQERRSLYHAGDSNHDD